MNRLVTFETVSAYCGSFFRATQTGCAPNAAQFLLWVTRSELQKQVGEVRQVPADQRLLVEDRRKI